MVGCSVEIACFGGLDLFYGEVFINKKNHTFEKYGFFNSNIQKNYNPKALRFTFSSAPVAAKSSNARVATLII